MLVLGRYDDRGRDKVIEEDIRIGKSAKGERERERRMNRKREDFAIEKGEMEKRLRASISPE